MEGIGMGLLGVVAPASIAMWFPQEKQGAPMGIWATWVPTGSLAMYILAPALGTSAGWQAVWWVGAGFTLVVMLAYGLLMRAPKSVEALAGRPARSKRAQREISVRRWQTGISGCSAWNSPVLTWRLSR